MTHLLGINCNCGLTPRALSTHIYGIDLKNYHIITNVKIKAFLIVSRPNREAHRVLRLVLDKNRHVGHARRNYVETSPFFWEILDFFFQMLFSNIRKALNVLKVSKINIKILTIACFTCAIETISTITRIAGTIIATNSVYAGGISLTPVRSCLAFVDILNRKNL